jgi:hypothetical protein
MGLEIKCYHHYHFREKKMCHFYYWLLLGAYELNQTHVL